MAGSLPKLRLTAAEDERGRASSHLALETRGISTPHQGHYIKNFMRENAVKTDRRAAMFLMADSRQSQDRAVAHWNAHTARKEERWRPGGKAGEAQEAVVAELWVPLQKKPPPLLAASRTSPLAPPPDIQSFTPLEVKHHTIPMPKKAHTSRVSLTPHTHPRTPRTRRNCPELVPCTGAGGEKEVAERESGPWRVPYPYAYAGFRAPSMDTHTHKQNAKTRKNERHPHAHSHSGCARAREQNIEIGRAHV